MFKHIFDTFRKPSARMLAQRELEDAQRDLLVSQTQTEYYSAITQYNVDRVARLTEYLVQPQGNS